MSKPYDAVLVLSFGGPERPEDVIPFLENVLHGRNVPRERLLEVAEHYYHFGGRSPINDQNRELVAALRAELHQSGIGLPVFWGNRNWAPYLADTLGEMAGAGVRRALVYVTSAFGSYSGCRQYLEDIDQARAAVPGAPEIHKLRAFFNHSGFIETWASRLSDARAGMTDARVVFTAHSVPLAMADSSPYVVQLSESCKLVGDRVGLADWDLAYQSRSGPPGQPWLEPDILDTLRALSAAGVRDVIVAPIGFVSDHMEVIYDLDTEAAALADDLGMKMVRAKTPGTHPTFVAMIRELIQERIAGSARRTVGSLVAAADECPAGCCPPPRRPEKRQGPVT